MIFMLQWNTENSDSQFGVNFGNESEYFDTEFVFKEIFTVNSQNSDSQNSDLS